MSARLSAIRPVTCSRGGRALVDHLAQVRVRADQGVGQQREVLRPGLDRVAAGHLGGEHGVAVVDQLDRLQDVRVRVVDQLAGAVDDLLQVGAPALQRRRRARGPWSAGSPCRPSSPAGRGSAAVRWCRSGSRCPARAIFELSCRYGPLSRRGCRSTYCSPIADRFATTASRSFGIFTPLVDVEVHLDAVGQQLELADPADRLAAVRHLGAGEDAAGLGEAGADRVVLVEEQLVHLGVLRAHEGDADDGDQQEHHQLDPDRSGDHLATPGIRTLASSGSNPDRFSFGVQTGSPSSVMQVVAVPVGTGNDGRPLPVGLCSGRLSRSDRERRRTGGRQVEPEDALAAPSGCSRRG